MQLRQDVQNSVWLANSPVRQLESSLCTPHRRPATRSAARQPCRPIRDLRRASTLGSGVNAAGTNHNDAKDAASNETETAAFSPILVRHSECDLVLRDRAALAGGLASWHRVRRRIALLVVVFAVEEEDHERLLAFRVVEHQPPGGRCRSSGGSVAARDRSSAQAAAMD